MSFEPSNKIHEQRHVEEVESLYPLYSTKFCTTSDRPAVE